MDPLGHTGERTRTALEGSRRMLHWILPGLAVVGLALYWLWNVSAERRAIRALTPEQRAALHQSALESLKTACSSADPSLDDYCRAQARVLLDLPECDALCRELALRQLHSARGTR